MLKIVLASRSPRRKKLLEQLGISFNIVPSTNEEIITTQNPPVLVTDLAAQKAREVAHTISNALVIGADTIVVFNGEILGKPETPEHAKEMLYTLSGATHQVYTGVSFVKTDADGTIIKEHSFYEETKVQFSPLSGSEIEAYVASGSPLDKAGAYGIQDDWGAVFVKRIEGDYYNVVGFPLNRFYNELKDFEPTLLSKASIPNV